MKILFLSLTAMEDMESQSIYLDLLKTFRNHGDEVYAVSPREKRTGLPTEYIEADGMHFLRVKIGNIQKTGLIEKGIATLTVNRKFLSAISFYLSNVDFDLIIYTTPPTTIYKTVEKVKRKTGAKAYLLLKDIFPQNAVDLGLLSNTGAKGILTRYFKHTEKRTYNVSDWIGCMSEANKNYLLKHEPQIDPDTVEVNPNSLTPRTIDISDSATLREKYGIDPQTKLFVYGGNLGRPQCIDFLIELLRLNETDPAGYFIIAGQGTDRPKLESFFEIARPQRSLLLPNLPRSDFDRLLKCCDAGLILLDPRFTIPNFPSRMLSYMQADLPIIAVTDLACDMGDIAEINNFGIKLRSDAPDATLAACQALQIEELRRMGQKAKQFFLENYTTETTYNLIKKRMFTTEL